MLHFYKAEIADAQAIAELVNSAYRGESSRRGWTTEADILEGKRTIAQDVAAIIRRGDAFILLGVLRDEIVASICCERQMLAGNPAVHFGMIAVKPVLQNKGYGKSLIQAAEAMTSREWGVVGYYMSVISLRVELIAFYERLGYLRTGEFRNFPENAALWQPKLEGLSLEYLAKLN